MKKLNFRVSDGEIEELGAYMVFMERT